jgi:hypothetical protein
LAFQCPSPTSRHTRSFHAHTNVPRRVIVDERHDVLLHKLLEVVALELDRVHSGLGVHLVEGLVVLLVGELAGLTIPSREHPLLPGFVELPLVDVLGDVLPVRP